MMIRALYRLITSRLFDVFLVKISFKRLDSDCGVNVRLVGERQHATDEQNISILITLYFDDLPLMGCQHCVQKSLIN